LVLELADCRFEVDVLTTLERTKMNSLDHCNCGYCKNYYEAMPVTYPQLVSFLENFGVYYQGPSEVMPFEPTYVLTCYRVQGKILQFGTSEIFAGKVPVSFEMADESSFFLWAGEMALPWLQEEPEEDVISPANLPEFLDRMEEVWLLRHGAESIQC
jgi:hypothetical protein